MKQSTIETIEDIFAGILVLAGFAALFFVGAIL